MTTEPVRLLIVEDNPGDARLLREMLNEEDAIQFDLVLVERLEDAVEQIGQMGFDVVLSDLSLPDAHGLDTLVRLLEKAPGMPIIVLTGTDDVNLGLRAVQAGAQDYLVKGQVDGTLLARTLRYAIERKRMAIELEQTTLQQLDMKDKFLSHVSHELRSPLTTVYQFVTILLDGLAGDMLPEQREYLEIALRNVNQLRTMIRDLLDVTRARTGKLVIECQCTSLIELIMETVRSKQATARAKGVELGIADLGYLPPVDADPDRVRQILTNLIDNALKFTPEGGSVEIGAAIDPRFTDFLRVYVKDTGCGISEAGVARIFEHLYQEDNNIESSRKGLGIGLFICRELTVRHGGQIWVDSEIGAGSTFHFTLQKYPLHQLLELLLATEEPVSEGLSLLVIELSTCDPQIGARLGESVRHITWSCIAQNAVAGRDLLLPRLSSMPWGELMFMVTRQSASEGYDLAERIQAQIHRCDDLHEAVLNIRVVGTEIATGSAEIPNSAQQHARLIVERIESAIRATIEERRR